MNTSNHYKLRNKSFLLIGVMVSLSMVLAACMTAATPTNAPVLSSPSNTQPAVATQQTVINVATDPVLGKILVDDKGLTLYIFTKDAPDTSNCDAKCLASWPALVSAGTPKAGPGVDASLIGSATLATGEKIVTYDHMPLYYFVKDTQAGQTSGEDVGSVWFVVSPDGKPVKPAASSAPIATPDAAATVPTLRVATDVRLGQILVDGKGMTLYAFTKDGPDQSTCAGTCLTNWPPLLAQGTPKLSTGVDDSKVGSAILADGKKIVTYNHMPLYYFAKDTKPGDTNGQGVGSVWYAVNPEGEIIQSSSATSLTAAPATGMAEPTLMVVTDPKLGQILVDGKGMTLYAFTKDGPDQSTCVGTCLVNWPPLLTQGHPIVGTGADDSKIGSALLADGTKIVTYNHMPLYYFVKDTKSGDILGQGVGSVWYVVNRDGEIIK